VLPALTKGAVGEGREAAHNGIVVEARFRIRVLLNAFHHRPLCDSEAVPFA